LYPAKWQRGANFDDTAVSIPLLYGPTIPAKPEGRSDCALHSGQDGAKTRGSAMRTQLARCGAIAAVLLCLPSLLFAQIQVTPVVSGLSSPLFVGHAGDGSNRLFIEERGGVIKVLQSGSSTPTVFLNISSKIVAGGERGLLGLAFHPQYISNGRFFVFYTRTGDGALVIAEYQVSTNSNVADPLSEKILLTIPHSENANHNGGMLAFGQDGYLYIGVGDGGGVNDPPNNAQNINVLLGKILRIDVNVPSGYVSPPSNPFVGVEGRDEIFALGMRNPWRFSFDRSTGLQWVADVGQGAVEEVDTPITNGGNYGWKLWEGTSCTDPDPQDCVTGNFIFPTFEYTHTGSRCSITGGYVYRGSLETLPPGTYVYGDFCTGEILRWNGSNQALLLDTSMSISSFGEDEAGEIYVVNLGTTAGTGSVGVLSPTPSQCTYAISPTRATFGSAAATGSVTITAGIGCDWTAASNSSWITVTGGATGSGNGTVTYSVTPYSGKPRNRNGSITIAGRTFNVKQSR
jgi:glucose/arabinose dehydrogenase